MVIRKLQNLSDVQLTNDLNELCRDIRKATYELETRLKDYKKRLK